MHPHPIPGVIVSAVAFAILFPLLMRVFARKWIGWSATAIAVAVYVVVGLLLEYADFGNRLTGLFAG